MSHEPHHHHDDGGAGLAGGVMGGMMGIILLVVVALIVLIAVFAWQPWSDDRGTAIDIDVPAPADGNGGEGGEDGESGGEPSSWFYQHPGYTLLA